MILKPTAGGNEEPEKKSDNPFGKTSKNKSSSNGGVPRDFGSTAGIGRARSVIGRGTINSKGEVNAKGMVTYEDPAILAMRSAGLQTTGRELVPVKEYAKKDPSELEERPSDIAKRVFEEHGLDFVFVANKVHEIMDGGEAVVQLKALEMVNKILLKSEEENEEMKKLLEQARTPSVVINIASPFSQENKSHLDILIPS